MGGVVRNLRNLSAGPHHFLKMENYIRCDENEIKSRRNPTHKIQYIYFREFLRHNFFFITKCPRHLSTETVSRTWLTNETLDGVGAVLGSDWHS
jgi:hypothetical protein